MASYGPQPVVTTFEAGADLSAAQYTVVKLNSSGLVVAVAAITDVPIGILQNAPVAGAAAEVLVTGGSKLVATAAITLPAVLGVDAVGKGKKLTVGTDTTQYVIGQATAASGGANEVISGFFNFANLGRAA